MHWEAKSFDLLYCNIPFIVVIWNWICNISKGCLYTVQKLSHTCMVNWCLQSFQENSTGGNNCFNKWSGIIGQPYERKVKGGRGEKEGKKRFLHTILKINIKCFITEIRSKTIKPLEESIGEQKCSEIDHEFV